MIDRVKRLFAALGAKPPDESESGGHDELHLAAAALLAEVALSDTNFDDKVSIADLSTFALNFGTSPGGNAWALGDFNSDAQINDDDLMLLALNFGTDLDAGLAAVGLSLDAAASLFGVELRVPEPSTVLLTIAGTLVAAARRRPRPDL